MIYNSSISFYITMPNLTLRTNKFNMTIKLFSLSLLIVFFGGFHSTASLASDKAVQHLELDDIDSFDEAKHEFMQTTLALRSKEKLDATELNEIHIITYSLEKAVAYFAENLQGEQQSMAKK